MKTALPSSTGGRPTLGVVIRFKNSAATLPGVLAAICRQTVQPDLIIAVNNQKPNSPALLREAGAMIVDWTLPYHHSRVLNFAFRECPTDLVIVLSSHTVFESTDAIAQLLGSMADPRTACASGKWDADPFYSDVLDWAELQRKGLKFGSIYSNSMGIVRRSLWQAQPFDESLVTMEMVPGGGTVERGRLCRRLNFPFSYQRGGKPRDFICGHDLQTGRAPRTRRHLARCNRDDAENPGSLGYVARTKPGPKHDLYTEPVAGPMRLAVCEILKRITDLCPGQTLYMARYICSHRGQKDA